MGSFPGQQRKIPRAALHDHTPPTPCTAPPFPSPTQLIWKSQVTQLVRGLEEERALEMGISAGLGEASWGFEVCLQRKDKTGSGDL